MRQLGKLTEKVRSLELGGPKGEWQAMRWERLAVAIMVMLLMQHFILRTAMTFRQILFLMIK